MNMVREERPQFREAERGDNFLKVLEYLLRRLQFGSIPMVFFRTNNLLDGLHVGEIESVKGYLKSAIKSGTRQNAKKFGVPTSDLIGMKSWTTRMNSRFPSRL